MKKITTSFLGLLSLLFLNTSSEAATPLTNSGKTVPNKNISLPRFHKPMSQSTTSVGPTTRWYSYAETIDEYFQGTSVLSFNYLFPDSNILAEFGAGEYSSPFVHLLGDILDVRSSKFNDPITYPASQFMQLTATSKYKVDSLKCYFVYTRVDTSVTDSLIFEVCVNNTNNSTPEYYFTGMAADYGVDTVRFKAMRYTYQTNRINFTGNGTTKKRYAIALNNQTITDTLENGFSVAQFSTADLPIVNAGKFVISTVSFKPSYSYSLVDTLNNLNHVTFISLEEQDGGFPIYTPGDYNISQVVTTDVRYNLDPAPGWNGLFIPSVAYTAPFSFEHHYISYKISSLCTADYDLAVSGTPEVSTGNGTATAVVTGGTAPFSYVWTPGNLTGATVAGLTAGGYTCTVTDANGCQVSKTIVITGINERSAEESTFNMLPNPATNKVTIEYTADKAVQATVRLVSINGQEVYTENFAQAKGKNIQNIDISGLAKGVYFLQLRSENANISKKLIKN
ncbi:MAG: T9SS type A sorting domain-containing protein [Bacteroidota bacterium]